MRRAGGQSRKTAREANTLVCAVFRDKHDATPDKIHQSIVNVQVAKLSGFPSGNADLMITILLTTRIGRM